MKSGSDSEKCQGVPNVQLLAYSLFIKKKKKFFPNSGLVSPSLRQLWFQMNNSSTLWSLFLLRDTGIYMKGLDTQGQHRAVDTEINCRLETENCKHTLGITGG